MTILALRSLHAILGEAIDDIERVYTNHGYSTNSNTTSTRSASENISTQRYCEDHQEIGHTIGHSSTATSNSQAYVSPPPSPSQTSGFPFESSVDFPALDAPFNPTSLSEGLTSHPVVQSAISRLVAAAGQMITTVQNPFLTICDATMGYHLPSCMRLLEASHVVEILREAGPGGLHVDKISEKNGVKATKLAHILRLLATHHIIREVSPDVFTLNRISSLVDSGKSFSELRRYQEDGMPEKKYQDTTGVAAFVGLCTDEMQKASAYMTETYYLSPSKDTRAGTEPTRAPFCFAFDTIKSGTSFFGWLEGEDLPKSKGSPVYKDATVETGQGGRFAPTVGRYRDIDTPSPENPPFRRKTRLRLANCSSPTASTDSESRSTSTPTNMNDDHSGSGANSNRFRLERFGKAMSGTDGWEAPGAALNGFDWHSLPRGSVVVDVGGGIGSTSMLLATAFSSSVDDENGPGLKFIIQDRPVVCEMGEKAWKAKCPELLESTACFQVHDFFTPQPVRNAAVFLLRVVLHDWPDKYARKILLRLREAAMPQTKLVIADFVLPLACPEDMTMGGLEDVEGAETAPVPPPLLPNLGKACANVYWMDLTMQTMFNSQERTLRELVSLAASAGWKISKVSRTAGSLFGYLVAEPTIVPEQEAEPEREPSSVYQEEDRRPPPAEVISNNPAVNKKALEKKTKRKGEIEMIRRASSRCGTPTFGSNTRLSSVEEALSRFGGGMIRPKAMSRTTSMPSPIIPINKQHPGPLSLKSALSLSSSSTLKKKKPSSLSVTLPIHSSPSQTNSPPSKSGLALAPSLPSPRQPSGPKTIMRRMSMANLRPQYSPSIPVVPSPSLPLALPISPQRQPLPLPISPQRLLPISPLSPLHPQSQAEAQSSKLRRRASHAQLSSAHGGLGVPYDHEAPASLPPLSSFPLVSLPPPSMLPVRLPGLSKPAPLYTHASYKNPTSTTSILGSPQTTSSRVLSHTASSSRKGSLMTHPHPHTASAVSSSVSSGAFRKRSRTVVGSSLRDGRSGLTLNADPHVGVVQLDADVGAGSANETRGHIRHMSTSMLLSQTLAHNCSSVMRSDVNVLAAPANIQSVQPPSSQVNEELQDPASTV